MPPGTLEGGTVIPVKTTPEDRWRGARRLFKGLEADLDRPELLDDDAWEDLRSDLSEVMRILLQVVDAVVFLEEGQGIRHF